jgi:hypothetical protein
MIDIILIAFFFCLRLFVFGPWLEYGIDRQLTKYTHGSALVAIENKNKQFKKLKKIKSCKNKLI